MGSENYFCRYKLFLPIRFLLQKNEHFFMPTDENSPSVAATTQLFMTHIFSLQAVETVGTWQDQAVELVHNLGR